MDVNDIDNTPLALMEEFWLRDEHPAQPVDTSCMFSFTGSFSHESIEAALKGLSGRHPLLTKKVEKRGEEFYWVASQNQPEIVWKNEDLLSESENPEQFPFLKPINIYQESGLRLWVFESANRGTTKFLFQIHHSICDGVSEVRMLEDFLFFYAKDVGLYSQDEQLPDLDIESFRNRGKFYWNWKSFLKNLPMTLCTFYKAAREIYNPVKRHELPPLSVPVEKYPYVTSLEMSPEDTKKYQLKARKHKVLTNELLMRDILVALDEWRAKNGEDFNRKRTCLMLPANLRTIEQSNIPVSNIFTALFFNYTKRQLSSEPTKFLQRIHRDMEYFKRHDQKYVFVWSLSKAKKAGILQKCLDAHNGVPSIVLSNIGKFKSHLPKNELGEIVIGENVLKTIDASLSLRPYILMNFCTFVYAKKIRLCLRYDGQILSQAEVEDFMTILGNKIKME